MRFVGRSRELGALRQLLDRREPQFVRVVGMPGVGKSALVRRVAADYGGLAFACPPGPDPFLRAALRQRLDAVDGVAGDRAAGDRTGADGLDDDWPALAALVLDDADRLSAARSRFLGPLLGALGTATREGIPLHVVLVGRAAGLPGSDQIADRGARNAPDEERGPVTLTTLPLLPLPFRAVAELLPRTEPDARLRAYGVFGGIPRVLSRLDTEVTVGTNVRRLLLDPDGPLADAPLAWLEREIQTPSRYVAILRALADGPAGWGAIHAGVPDLTRSGQVAPYLARLDELGMVRSATSLDAAPRSRSTRYELTDPFLAFWFRFVLPWRASEDAHRPDPPLREHYATRVRPGIDAHLERVLPAVARRHVALDALGSLGAAAREAGSLWGADYDIPVAGMLESGAAFYGTCAWAPSARDASPLEGLDAAMRRTRYGFGRERRLRLLFTGRPAPMWLRREVARRTDTELIDAAALAGG